MGNEHNHNFAAIVLAAGKGTRMRSSLPKVMHKVAGLPLIQHVLAAVGALSPEKVVTIIAPGMDSVKEAAKVMLPDCRFAVQEEQKGTGHAVGCAAKELKDYDAPILILCADTPLLTPHTLHHMIHAIESADIVVLGMQLPDPTGYGRLVMDSSGQLEEIIEERDATDEQKRINLCNAGVYMVRGRHLFDLVAGLSTTNAASEYYLTDIVSKADEKGLHCRVALVEPSEVLGVNSRDQLAHAEYIMQQRLRFKVLSQGVTMTDPSTVFLQVDTNIAPDVIIHPHVVFGPGVEIETGTEIKSFSHIEGAKIGKNSIVGPYARIRPGSILSEESHIGNFVEIKKSTIGKGAKINHLSYVGDATIGAKANIGAGTITCNYDGVNKHQTEIGAGAFIGSNTALVAPVKVGEGAVVAAGSVITEDVPEAGLAIARERQVNKAKK